MNEMNITSAQYTENNLDIIAVIDGKTIIVPAEEGNRHYDEIMRQVDAGDLVVTNAETQS